MSDVSDIRYAAYTFTFYDYNRIYGYLLSGIQNNHENKLVS